MPSVDYQFLKDEIVRDLFNKAPDQRTRIILRILSNGLRPCELLRLDVKDIVLNNNPPYINVREPKGYKKEPFRWCKICKERFPVEYMAHEHETTIKNRPIKPRKVPIEDPIMVDDLRIFLHNRKLDEPLLIATRNPIRRISYSTLYHIFKELVKTIGKTDLILYDLRHFKGKELKKRGIPDSVGAALLGHSVWIYAHTYGQLDVSDIDDVLKLFPQQQK